MELAFDQKLRDPIGKKLDVVLGVGLPPDPALSEVNFGPAHARYCASPEYLKRRGSPNRPDQLLSHDCIQNYTVGPTSRWVFRDGEIRVPGRLRLDSFSMVYDATLAGLGIAVLPEFVCAEDIERGRLVTVLDDWVTHVGDISMMYATQQYLVPRVRTFMDLAKATLGPALVP